MKIFLVIVFAVFVSILVTSVGFFFVLKVFGDTIDKSEEERNHFKY